MKNGSCSFNFQLKREVVKSLFSERRFACLFVRLVWLAARALATLRSPAGEKLIDKIVCLLRLYARSLAQATVLVSLLPSLRRALGIANYHVCAILSCHRRKFHIGETHSISHQCRRSRWTQIKLSNLVTPLTSTKKKLSSTNECGCRNVE